MLFLRRCHKVLVVKFCCVNCFGTERIRHVYIKQFSQTVCKCYRVYYYLSNVLKQVTLRPVEL